MTPTKTVEYLTYLLTNGIGSNLVSYLINMPSLGITDTPTDDQLLLRQQLTMVNAVAQELSGAGYKRNLLSISTGSIVYTSNTITVPVVSTFTNSGGNIGPFTHICYARGANITGANSTNGNNRGDTTGTLIQVEPVTSAPLTIAQNVNFIHTATFTFNVSLS